MIKSEEFTKDTNGAIQMYLYKFRIIILTLHFFYNYTLILGFLYFFICILNTKTQILKCIL